MEEILKNVVIKKNARSKRLRLSVIYDGKIIITAPIRCANWRIENFIKEHMIWIENKQKEVKLLPPRIQTKGSPAEYEKYKEPARVLANQRLIHFNVHHGFTWDSINIKNTSTRWGSCSAKKNLNFNYKISLIAPELADYIIVHELCHLGQMNHSKKFWQLILKTLPNYKELKKRIKNL